MMFRWSVWGSVLPSSLELLRYSILSFRKQFGSGHRYIVYTDNPELVSKNLEPLAEIKYFFSVDNVQFYSASQATWMKWCPTARLDIGQVEFHVDSDVFLLRYPKEIDSFLADPQLGFAIMDEFLGAPWQHGAMQVRSDIDTPFINAGFFIQKAGYDIGSEMLREFEWWQSNIIDQKKTHHDEQGALAIVLGKYLRKGQLYVLPKDKYAIISPSSNSQIEDVSDLTLFHATYPTHPAFYRFKYALDRILSE